MLFNSTYFCNLVPLKKHLLSSDFLELKFFESPHFANTFSVSCNIMTNPRQIVIIVIFLILNSCKSYEFITYDFQPEIQVKTIDGKQKLIPSSYTRKSITFDSDSTLNYTTLFGDIGKSTKIKYKIIRDSLKIDSIDFYGKKTIQGYNSKEIFGIFTPYNKDSLIINNEKYYSRKITEDLKKKNFEDYYLMFNKKNPTKVTLKNKEKIAKKIRKLKLNYKAEILDPEIAFKEFGIEKKYNTINLIIGK